jgi:hypothetical protein
MANNQAYILEVLQSELAFLEGGGYQWCLQKPWRPPLVFVESRTCPKHAGTSTSCEQCALAQFVPAESLGEKTPCWHIPLNEAGQTVDSLYRWGTEEEMNQSLKTWLLSTILSIEDERRAARRQALKNHAGAPTACEIKR